MIKNELHYQIAVGLLDGIGVRTAKNLIAHFGGVKPIFELPIKKLGKEIPGFSKQRLMSLNRTEALRKAEDQLNFILKYDLGAHFYLDESYPYRLKNCVDAPIVLFTKGNFNLNPVRTVAVVGTRQATDYGKRITEELIAQLVPYGVQVVSGLAFGVDGIAHRAALNNGLPTLGVLAHGLDRLYPSQHKSIVNKMLDNEGGLITEFLVGTNPDRENFPKRNRIVAGMTDATIVIESGKSGGSMITANLANDYNRDVFAYPGSVFQPFSAGCNQLIGQHKAHLVTEPKQIVEMLGWKLTSKKEKKGVVQRKLFPDLNLDETEIVEVLQKNEMLSIDQLSDFLKKKVSQLNMHLLNLELIGVVASLPGKNYKIVQ